MSRMFFIGLPMVLLSLQADRGIRGSGLAALELCSFLDSALCVLLSLWSPGPQPETDKKSYIRRPECSLQGLNPAPQAPKRVQQALNLSMIPPSWAQMDLCVPKISMMPSSGIVGLFVCGGGTMCGVSSVGPQVWWESELRGGLLVCRFRRLGLQFFPHVANCLRTRWCFACLKLWKASSSLASSSVRCVRAWPARSCLRPGKGPRRRFRSTCLWHPKCPKRP